MTFRVGVLVSGVGTNLQALLDACRDDPAYPARLVLVGCNRAGVPALDRARAANVPVCLADRAVIGGRGERQAVLLQALRDAAVDLVVLAGFDEILLPSLVDAYRGRIVNTHPSLLPAFGGTMHAVEAALAHGVKVSGCTVHLVTDDVDGGPIVLQACVSVEDTDDVVSLRARIQAQEHRLVPEVVRAFAERRVRIEGRRGRVIRSG